MAMMAKPLAASLARRGIHYGWAMAAVTFLTMLVTSGTVGAPSVLIVPLEQEYGWNPAEISPALAVRFVLYGLIGPFTAALLNRYGLRPITLTALGLIACGLLGALVMTQPWHLMLCWGLVVGVGTGLTALVLGATVATRWFTTRRGLVVGLLTASAATGQLIFLPLLADITERFGWRAAVMLLCVMLALAAVAVLMVMCDRPADLGLRPYGDTALSPPPAGPVTTTIFVAPLQALAWASRNWTFWVLFATFFVCGLSTNGLFQTYFVAMCGDYGLLAVGAAGILALMGVFDFVGTIASGWLSDRYDNRWLLFWYYGLRGLSLLFLPYTGFDFYGLSLFAVFYGLDWVATVPPTVKLAAARFGPERSNMVFGWIFAGHQLGAGAAALGGGFAKTAFASYLPAFVIAGALCLAAAGLVLTVRRVVAARA